MANQHTFCVDKSDFLIFEHRLIGVTELFRVIDIDAIRRHKEVEKKE